MKDEVCTMNKNPTVAVIQEPPVFLNLPASMDKAVRLIEAAAADGAHIISFAECWLPGYPVWLDFAPEASIWDHAGAKALFRLLAENSVVAGDENVKRLQEVADKTGTYIVMGTHERDGATLYNTTFTFSPKSAEPKAHRKLVPTYTERLVWGRGDGAGLHTTDTPWGALGSLICWEHWMPLARAAMHARREFLHIAQWPVVKEMHQVASRHYAFEGRCAVAAAGSIMTHADIMEGFTSLGADEPTARMMLESMPGSASDFVHAGGSAIIAADGAYITEPVFEKACTILGTLDLQQQMEEWQTLDTHGHYSRPDIFELYVNTARQPGVVFADKPE